MTNEEAVQWCSDKVVQVQFTPTGRVQVRLQISEMRNFYALQVRLSFAEAVEVIKNLHDQVRAGSISPAHPSLVSAALPSEVVIPEIPGV
jgi:hypothetical protein